MNVFSDKLFISMTLLVIVLGLVAVGIISRPAEDTSAQSSFAVLQGYAWSENIGWVSFNCLNDDSCASSDYKVEVQADGTLGGYAWSDSIGWISFESTDTSDCPDVGTGTCAPELDGTDLKGYARAVSPKIMSESYENGGWDGWINLSGVSYNASTNEFSGYAWGSDVVGWIHFDPDVDRPVILVGSGAPGVTISADPVEINEGEDATLTWETTGAVSCEASGAWSGAKDPAEGAPKTEVISNIQETSNYTLTCESVGGVLASSTVHILVRTENFGLNLNTGTVQMFTSETVSPPATLTLVADGGFSGDVSLSSSFVVEPSTPGVTIVAPSSISGGEAEDVYINTPNGIEPGIYQVQITGTADIGGSPVVRTTTLTIYVEKDPIDYEDF